MAVRGCAGARAGRRLPESRQAPGRGEADSMRSSYEHPVAPGRVRDARGEPRREQAGRGTGIREKNEGRGAASWGTPHRT